MGANSDIITNRDFTAQDSGVASDINMMADDYHGFSAISTQTDGDALFEIGELTDYAVIRNYNAIQVRNVQALANFTR